MQPQVSEDLVPSWSHQRICEKSLKLFLIFLNKTEICVSGLNPPAGSGTLEQSVSVPPDFLQGHIFFHFLQQNYATNE